MRPRDLTLLVLATLLPSLALAQGGPPMVTDDPGTPGNGRWEINIASLFATKPNQLVVQAPYFDINYGLGDRTQLKVEGGGAVARQGGSTQTGTSSMLAGVKFRFLEESQAGIAVSTYPQIQFRQAVSQPGTQYIIPLEATKTFGSWELNPEVGGVTGAGAPNQVFYGLVVAFENVKPWELLFETRAATNLDSSGTETLVNVGARYTCNPNINLLAAIGHTVTHYNDSTTELDAYLGVQLEL